MKFISVFTDDPVTLHEGIVHKGLTNKDYPFFKFINLVPNPIHPYLWLLDISVYVDHMLNLFSIEQHTGVCGD